MTNSPIDRLTPRDEPAAVVSLTAAFAEYPLFPPLCASVERRPHVIAAFCRFLFHMSLRCNGAFATADRSAVALTWPPGSEWPGRWANLRAGGLSLVWRLGWRSSRLLTRLERAFDAAVSNTFGPHWYLRSSACGPIAGQGLSRLCATDLRSRGSRPSAGPSGDDDGRERGDLSSPRVRLKGVHRTARRVAELGDGAEPG